MPSPVKRSSVPSCVEDQPAHRGVVLAEHAHHLLGLGGLGEGGEAAQVEEDDRDLAPMALQRIVGAAGDDRSASCGEKKRFSRPDPLELRDAVGDALLERAVPVGSSAFCRCTSSYSDLMRSSERTRASSSAWLIGLVRKSSAPASRPFTRSCAGIERRHQHDRQHGVRRVGADRAAHLVAAHAGHHHVEQDQVGPLRRDALQRLGARGGRDRRVALRAEQVGEQLDVLRRVVDDQDLAARLTPACGRPTSIALHRLEEGLQVDRLASDRRRSPTATIFCCSSGITEADTAITGIGVERVRRSRISRSA